MHPARYHSTRAELSANDDLIGEHDAARLMGVSVHTARDWRRKGRGPTFMRLSASPGLRGRIFYSRADLALFLSSRIVSPGADAEGAND